MNSVKSSFKVHDKIMKYRHIDPPWLWMAVFTCSILLHLFVFWLLLTGKMPVTRQSFIVDIDLIDIPSSDESAATTVKPTVPSSTQKSITGSLPKTTVTTSKNPDNQLINSDLNLSQQRESKNTEVNNQSLEANSTPTPTSTFTPQTQFTPAPIPTETIPSNDLPWNRRQEIKLGKGNLLPNDIPLASQLPTPQPETPSTPTPQPETTPTPTPQPETPSTPTPQPETPSTPTPQPETTTAKTGGLLANIAPILRNEVEQLRQDGQLKVDALPDVLAEYQGLPSKELQLSFLSNDSELKPANILASLIIDKNGNFQQAVIISIEPITLSSEKKFYEQALKEIFQEQSFVAAYNQDGSKPELSNLYVRITIDPINFQ